MFLGMMKLWGRGFARGNPGGARKVWGGLGCPLFETEKDRCLMDWSKLKEGARSGGVEKGIADGIVKARAKAAPSARDIELQARVAAVAAAAPSNLRDDSGVFCFRAGLRVDRNGRFSGLGVLETFDGMRCGGVRVG